MANLFSKNKVCRNYCFYLFHVVLRHSLWGNKRKKNYNNREVVKHE